MKSIRVSKKDLLEKIKENREIHESEYGVMIVTYKEKLLDALEKLIIKTKDTNKDFSTYIPTDEPKSYIKDYDTAIGMIEMAITDEFDISEEEYKRYVLNEWSWTRNFEFSKTSYM